MEPDAITPDGAIPGDLEGGDGIQLALNQVQEIYRVAQEIGHSEVIQYCQAALGIRPDDNDSAVLAKTNSRFTLSSLRDNTPKHNQALRFGPINAPGDNRRNSWNGQRSRSLFSSVAEHDYEEVYEDEILRAPIVDMCIIHKSDPVPPGFYRLAKTVSGKKADLCTGAGGHTVYICIQKDQTKSKPPITALTVIFPDKNEFVPPGFLVARRNGQPYDLNFGTGTQERVFLCYKRGDGNPIIDMQVVFPGKAETCPASFSLIDKSPSGRNANLNASTGGVPVVLAYRQALINVHALSNNEHPLEHKRSFPNGDLGKVHEHRARGAASTGSQTPPHHSPRPVSPPPTKVPSARAMSASGATATSDGEITPSAGATGVEEIESEEAPQQDDIDDLESESSYVGVQRGRSYDDVIVYPDGTIPPPLPRTILRPILAAIYVRQSTMAQLAINGLVSMLRQTQFFDIDLSNVAAPGSKTMLDLTIECVCDRLDHVLEREFEGLLNFTRMIIKQTRGVLSLSSQQRMFRAITFAVSCLSTRNTWLQQAEDFPFKRTSSEYTIYRSLVDLLGTLMRRTESIPVPSKLPTIGSAKSLELARSPRGPSLHQRAPPATEADAIVGDLLDHVITDAIDNFELSQITEGVLVSISKHSSQSTTDGLWNDLAESSRSLFEDHAHRSAFVLLAVLCKISSGGVRSTQQGEPVARDLGTKIVALEALNEYLLGCSESLRNSKVFGYQIRRLVVPCLLGNIAYAVFERRVYSRLLKLTFTLWRQFRAYIKMELAVLCDNLMLKVLHANSRQIRPSQKRLLCDEIQEWFDVPHHSVEVYLNFDMDRNLVSQFNIFGNLCEAMCTVAEQVFRRGVVGAPDDDEAKQTGLRALACVTQMGKCLMDAAGTAHLAARDGRLSKSGEDAAAIAPATSAPARPKFHRSRSGSIKFRRQVRQANEELLKQGLKIYKEKSLKKAIKFLATHNFLSDTPQEVASFLRLYNSVLDAESIGEFLSEGGTNRDEEYWNTLRYRYTRAISFVDMDLEAALRHFFSNAGFKCPGESQRIDRLLVAFSKCYWDDNSGTPACPFASVDTPYLLAYAIIILNTDLHKANLDPKKKKRQMTKEGFVNNLRGVDNNQDLNRTYLERIYDSIKDNPIELSSTDDTMSVAGDQSVKSEEIDSAQMVVRFVRSIVKNVKQNEELLRALAPYNRRFVLVGSDASISTELVAIMFDAVWFHFHGVIDHLNTQTPTLDISGPCLDLLRYMLSATIFLNLTTERAVFATQLARFKFVTEAKDNGHQVSHVSAYIATGRHNEEPWFKRIESATMEDAVEVVEELHTMVFALKDRLQRGVQLEELTAVAARIEKKAHLLDGNRTFVMEGDLTKRSRSGKTKPYRFFLFSDQLIYAHESAVMRIFKLHEQLPINVLKVADAAGDPTGLSFHILHPKKSFVVAATSVSEKEHWISSIQQAIDEAQRKRPLERRLSLLPRLEGYSTLELQGFDDGTDEHATLVAERKSELDMEFKLQQDEEFAPPPPPPPPTFEESEIRDDVTDDSSAPTESVMGDAPVEPEPEYDGSAAWKAAHPAARTGSVDHSPSPNIATFMATLASINPLELLPPPPPPPQSPNRVEPLSPGEDHKTALFRETLESMTERELSKMFVRGLKAWMKILDDDTSDIDDEVKLFLYGLYKQAKAGPPPSLADSTDDPNSVAYAKLQAWHRCKGYDSVRAKKLFLVTLTEVEPTWQNG